MATNSASAGYLAPTTSPDYDAALDVVLHDVIVGVTGLPGNLVRPKWQPVPPTRPEYTENWCSFGVQNMQSDYSSYDEEQANGLSQKVDRDEVLEVLHSFHGPNSTANARRLKTALSVGQNRDALTAAGIALLDVGDVRRVPTLQTERWVQKADLLVRYRRRVSVSFPVLTILSGQVSIAPE